MDRVKVGIYKKDLDELIHDLELTKIGLQGKVNTLNNLIVHLRIKANPGKYCGKAKT